MLQYGFKLSYFLFYSGSLSSCAIYSTSCPTFWLTLNLFSTPTASFIVFCRYGFCLSAGDRLSRSAALRIVARKAFWYASCKMQPDAVGHPENFWHSAFDILCAKSIPGTLNNTVVRVLERRLGLNGEPGARSS